MKPGVATFYRPHASPLPTCHLAKYEFNYDCRNAIIATFMGPSRPSRRAGRAFDYLAFSFDYREARLSADGQKFPIIEMQESNFAFRAVGHAKPGRASQPVAASKEAADCFDCRALRRSTVAIATATRRLAHTRLIATPRGQQARSGMSASRRAERPGVGHLFCRCERGIGLYRSISLKFIAWLVYRLIMRLPYRASAPP